MKARSCVALRSISAWISLYRQRPRVRSFGYPFHNESRDDPASGARCLATSLVGVMRIRRNALVTGLSLLMGCGTDPNTFHVGCGHISSVQAGPGLTPVIDWSPSCGVASLTVYEAHVPAPGEPPLPGTNLVTGRLMWSIDNPDSTGNILEPTVLRTGT
jgi:hypothetical protein